MAETAPYREPYVEDIPIPPEMYPNPPVALPLREMLRLGNDELPFEDGLPMADSLAQCNGIVAAYNALRGHYADRDDVAVHADMFVHYLVEVRDEEETVLDNQPALRYEPGDQNRIVERRCVAPDLFVAIGAPKLGGRSPRGRNSFSLWQEPVAPGFVMEVLSPSSWRRDLKEKHDLYRRLGIAEYWILDPYCDYVSVPLQGWRLRGRAYRDAKPLFGSAPQTGPDADGRLSGPTFHSNVLGLDMRVEMSEPRFRDPATGRDLPLYQDMLEENQRHVEENRRHVEENRRQREENERLRELLRQQGVVDP